MLQAGIDGEYNAKDIVVVSLFLLGPFVKNTLQDAFAMLRFATYAYVAYISYDASYSFKR